MIDLIASNPLVGALEMNNALAGTLAVLGGFAFLGLLYNLFTWRNSRAERRRRHAGETRIAVDIYEPFCATRMRCRCVKNRDAGEEPITFRCALREIVFSTTGCIDNRPIALPLFGSIVLAGVLVLLTLDPVMDDPLIWGHFLSDAWRATFPNWLRFIWVGLGICGAFALIGGAYFLTQQRIARQWLVLHADGRLAARGADMPVFDPREPYTLEEAVWFDHRGILIRQNGHELALVISPLATVSHVKPLNARIIAPSRAYAVGIGLEVGPVDRHLQAHFNVA